MTEKDYDPFAGETGLKDDFDGVITDAWFATDAKYNNGQTLLLFLKKQDDEGEETEDRYACGPDWGSYDGGETAEHPKGEKKGFNNQTAYYSLIAAAMESGAEDEMRRRSVEELERRGPKDARLWKGLKFHWEIKTETRTVPDDAPDAKPGARRNIEINRSLPTKYLGTVGVEGAGSGSAPIPAPAPAAAAPAPTPTPTPAEAAPATTAAPTPEAGVGLGAFATLDPAVAAQIKVLAATQSYADWVDSVMALPNVLSDANVMSALGDESFYNSLRPSGS